MNSVPYAPGWRSSGGPAPSVTRVMYASKAQITGSIYAEMERIRACAVRNNEPAGVATALLFQSGWFAQWKEGPGEAVMRIMEKVKTDPRHHSMQIVHSSRGTRLLGGTWSMAIVHCDDGPAEMEHRVSLLHRELEQGSQYSPQTVWRRLSTPMRHPGAAQQAQPDAFQRVLVCAAAGMAPFDLVKWLARLKGEEIVHRRFAGAYDLDVGTDYVDFAHDGRVMRLIAMARHGLALPLTRAFLPDYSHVLLMLSGDAERDQSLVRRVAEACVTVAPAPILLGVGPAGTNHAELMSQTRRHGLIYIGTESRTLEPRLAWEAVEPLLAGWQHAANSEWPVVPLQA